MSIPDVLGSCGTDGEIVSGRTSSVTSPEKQVFWGKVSTVVRGEGSDGLSTRLGRGRYHLVGGSDRGLSPDRDGRRRR